METLSTRPAWCINGHSLHAALMTSGAGSKSEKTPDHIPDQPFLNKESFLSEVYCCDVIYIYYI